MLLADDEWPFPSEVSIEIMEAGVRGVDVRRACAWICAGALACALSAAVSATAEPARDDFATAIDSMRQALGIPGLAAAVVSDGDVVFAEGFGHADLEAGIAAEASTPFGLASVTKPIAATLLMSLVEDGSIELDEPVASYGVSIVGDRGITVRHLLTHTSEGTPGEVHEYNGDRYGLLGGVIEGATGRTFADLLSERILIPFDMTDTALNPINNWGGLSASGLEDFARALGWGESYSHYPDVYRRLAKPYQFGEAYEPVEGMYHLFHSPAAGLVSSVQDLAAFDGALDGFEIVERATLTEMTTPAVRTQPGRADLNYGLGWYVQDFEGVRMVWHTGRWPPSTSALYLKIPAERLTFIVAANTDNLTVPFPGIGGGDVSRSAPMLTFFHHFVFPRVSDDSIPTVDWSADRASLLRTLRGVEEDEARTLLERELWSYRQAFASSGQGAQAEVLRRVAGDAFPGSSMSRDPSFTSTVGRADIVSPLPSASLLSSLARAALGWFVLILASLGWMTVRLVKDAGAGLWDWTVWLLATALIGPIAPAVHRLGWSRSGASVLCVVGYSIAWTIAVWVMITLAEPNPIAIIGATVVLPVLVGLFAIRARVIGRASAASYGQGVRRGALAEFVTWSVGFAVFFPLTFAADEFLFSTVPSPSSPFFGVLISGIAIVALIVLTGFHRMLERFGYHRPSRIIVSMYFISPIF